MIARILLFIVTYAYFIAAGACEGAAQGTLTVSQMLYHDWRLVQTAAFIALALWAARRSWPVIACAVVSGDALYNRVLIAIAKHSWTYSWFDGTYWSYLHYSAALDWLRFGIFAGIGLFFVVRGKSA